MIKNFFRHIKYALERVYVRFYSAFHKIEKQVLFDSFSGKQYSDNPRAISEKLHELYPDFKIYWILDKFNDVYNIVPSYVSIVPKDEGIFPFHFLRILSTSCCYVTNEALQVKLPKRANQHFVCTWHGDRAIKLAANDLPGFKGKLYEQELADLCLAGSASGEKAYRTGFLYNGEVLRKGTPRNDLLVRNDNCEKKEIKERLELPDEYKYLLYAPTFMDYKNNEVQYDEELSLCTIINILEKKTKSKWKVLVRAHSAAYGGFLFKEEDYKYIIDVSSYPDMADILLISDALITDYSSSAGDAALLNIPVILFQSGQYTRPLLFSKEESPYLTAHSQKELVEIVTRLNDDLVFNNCKSVLDYYDTNETGQASQVVAQRINEWYSEIC